MSKSARTDEIDALVSSVRDFVAHKEPRREMPAPEEAKLLLTPEARVDEPEIETPEAVAPETVGSEFNATQPEATRPEATRPVSESALPADLEQDIDATLTSLELVVASDDGAWDDDYSVEDLSDELKEGLAEVAAASAAAPAKSADQPPQPERDESADQTRAAPVSADAAEQAPEADVQAPAKAESDDAPQTSPDQPVDGLTATITHLANQSALEESKAALLSEETPDSAALPDAAFMRAMLTEIVHQELAGALGERITRNVRKLVRKEINRALASRALLDD